jgi:hypothetical protein
MWRSFVLILIAHPTKLSRSMESFRPQHATYSIKYDASLSGLGVGLYRLSDNSLLTYAALALPFVVTNESKRQNTMEFVAVVFGLLLTWRLNLMNFAYSLHGDSKSSLAWAKSNIKESSQKSYRSAWNKWEKFVQKYFTNSINSQKSTKRQKLTFSQKSQNDNSLQNSTNAKYTPNYKNMQYSELLKKLLMFVTYCVYELKCNVRSIPSIMFNIRYGMVTRLVQCCTAFDDYDASNVSNGYINGVLFVFEIKRVCLTNNYTN